MNILHLITHYYPHVYGAENFAQHIAEYQARNGNEVHVLTGRWQKEWPANEVAKRVKIHRVSVVKIRYLQTVLAIIPFASAAIQLVKQKKFTVIHTHIYPGMVIGAIVKKLFPITFIATIQGGDIGDYPEVFRGYAPLAKKLIGQSLKQADAVHCVSHYLANQVTKMGVDKRKIVVIPNGVDVNKFKIKDLESKHESKPKTIKLISTSRLEAKNNLLQLIKALSRIRNRGVDVRLDIYGTGSQKKKLETRIKNLNVDKQVNLKGYLNHDKLSETLPRYDFFIRLSTQEGFGISFIEAMACGVIPIGTKTGGITDIIQHGRNGYFINLQKPVSKQLERIFKTPKGILKRRSQKARLTVEQQFSWEKIYPQLTNLY